jgi:PilZ domain
MVMTRLTQWLSDFCSWHARFKSGTLGADELSAYMQARTDLGATLAFAQRLEIRGATGVRQAVRLARAVPVEFELPAGKVSALTQDVSVSGLSALVGEGPTVGTVVPFRLKLGRDIPAVGGNCRVVANIPVHGSFRMAVTFQDLSEEGRNRIETLVFDGICSEIRVMLRIEQPKGAGATPPPQVL